VAWLLNKKKTLDRLPPSWRQHLTVPTLGGGFQLRQRLNSGIEDSFIEDQQISLQNRLV
jgi:hypothetical protein